MQCASCSHPPHVPCAGWRAVTHQPGKRRLVGRGQVNTRPPSAYHISYVKPQRSERALDMVLPLPSFLLFGWNVRLSSPPTSQASPGRPRPGAARGARAPAAPGWAARGHLPALRGTCRVAGTAAAVGSGNAAEAAAGAAWQRQWRWSGLCVRGQLLQSSSGSVAVAAWQ